MIAPHVNSAYEEVKKINGKEFADMWAAGRASPSARPDFPYAVVNYDEGRPRLWFFDSEDTAREYIEFGHKYSLSPNYILRMVSVRHSRQHFDWESYT